MSLAAQPGRLGQVELANRLSFAPHATGFPTEGVPNEALIAYHEARARGGVGAIVLEHTVVHPSGGHGGATLAAYRPEIVPAYRRLAEAVGAHGTKLFTQLGHLGGQYGKVGPRPEVVGASAVPTIRFVTEPRALRADEVDDVIEGFAISARHCAEGGLAGIELSFAHNLLGGQFLSRRLNRRDDRWRRGPAFMEAVIERVRDAAPELALGVRLSASIEDSAEAAQALPGKVDFLSVTLGDASRFGSGTRVIPPPPIPPNAIAAALAPFRVGLPLLATGRVVEAAGIESLLGEGDVAVVGMARALVVDPQLPRKLADSRPADVVRCIGCNICATAAATAGIRCAMTPRTGRELTWSAPPAVAGERVAVIGGGPAGMSAAATAAEAGANVVLCEARGRLGGQMALAAGAPGHAETASAAIANLTHRLDAAGVEVRLDTDVDAAALDSLAADRVVIAAGAEPFVHPALDSLAALGAWSVLAGERPDDGPVVVLDWGGDPTGLALADLFAAEGRAVTLVSGAAGYGEAVSWFTRDIYLERLYRAGATLLPHFELDLDAGRPVLRNLFAHEVTRPLPEGAIVASHGRVPRRDLADAALDRGTRVTFAGDCRSPRTLEEAILEGELSATPT